MIDSTVGDLKIAGHYNTITATTIESTLKADLDADSNMYLYLKTVTGNYSIKLNNIGKVNISGNKVGGNICNKHRSSGMYKADIKYDITKANITIK